MNPIETLSNETCRAIKITRTLGARRPWKVKLSGPDVYAVSNAFFLWDGLHAAGCTLYCSKGRPQSSDSARLAVLAGLPKIGHVELIVNGHMATGQTDYDYLCDAQKAISIAERAIGSTYLCVPLWRLSSENIVQLHCGNGLNVIGASVVQVLGIAEDYMADLTAPVEPDPRDSVTDNSLRIIGQIHEYNDAVKLQKQLRDAASDTRPSLIELQNKYLREQLDMALAEIHNRDEIISKLEADLKKG